MRRFFSIKTYDLPNLESSNWFVTFQWIVWIMPRTKVVFQLSFHTLDADGVTAIRLVIEMHISGEVPKKKPVGKWLGLCNRNPDTHVSGECRGRPPRTLSLVREGLTESWRPQHFQQTRFETFVLRNSNRLFICKFWHLCYNITSITFGLICRSYNEFTLFI